MRLFDSRIKFPIHMLQLALAVAAIGVTVVRMFLPNAPRGRSGTMALGMGAKSLIIILYQVLTEHVSALKRWASLKANLILNALEIVFWAAVAYMSIQSNTQQCVGTTCTLSWVVVVIGILLSIVAGYATVISWLDFRYFKINGVARGSICHQQLPLHSRCNSSQSQSIKTIEVQGQNKRGTPHAVAPAHLRNGNSQYELEYDNQYALQYAQQYQQQYQQQYINQYHNQYHNQNSHQQRK
ncbi:uncharacterized protein ColSpa_03119 [Colletotrichum spaethianum]|uniref:MARVEL domain-containing protein n=1 Tax=Colletotrichum spaethianum TaxID=700344 RepID=A0AA37P013_9PEZI|nr:uncharacterized protein ColSpa_03119 [Colletotrichum spaethianum]GKT42938.1 hypothetical protein ColSpa_03119 [Colletotrichum spaethianum]